MEVDSVRSTNAEQLESKLRLIRVAERALENAKADRENYPDVYTEEMIREDIEADEDALDREQQEQDVLESQGKQPEEEEESAEEEEEKVVEQHQEREEQQKSVTRREDMEIDPSATLATSTPPESSGLPELPVSEIEQHRR